MSPKAQVREEFLSIVSHELRAPLNGIKSWTHVLENQLRETQDATTLRAIDGIMIGVEQQVRLIDDLLDMTLALSGSLVLARKAIALAPALMDAVEGLRALADEKGVRLTVHTSVDDAHIHGDYARIHQIISNLVSNAIHSTPRGGHVQVSMTLEGTTARVEVRDDGAGIPGDLLPCVFDPFRRAELGTTSRKQHGLGLGLALAQRLAELHGGHASCESAGVGRGTAFQVHFPIIEGRGTPTR